MALSALDYPTDIRWERVCVSQDMLDPKGCDDSRPPKWNSSLALFRYEPEAEYQPYEDRRILYYKVTCTLTSYQPESDAIEGSVDWDSLSAVEVADFEERLKSYLPCHGAMIQVSATDENASDPSDHPYFLDFQPKQRTLYEQVSESQERVSRSLDGVSVRKGVGNTDSVEALDIDQGYSAGVQGQYGGAGGGVNVSQSGQWGTKHIGQEEHTNVRTTDASRETRDAYSHTTQLSQMYNLFQAYHLGTNRALFYMAPRPHVVEEPSGFIRGPRQIDGIQELFLVVSQRKGREFPCMTVRLDTAHLTKTDLRDYDRSQQPGFAEAAASAPIPSRESADKVPSSGGDLLYDCFDTIRTDSDTYTAPGGFIIESTEDLVNSETNGSSTSSLSGDKRTLTVSGEARGHACFRNNAGDAANTGALVGGGGLIGGVAGVVVGGIAAAAGADVIAETTNQRAGSFHRKVKCNLRSEQPTKKTGEAWVLLVTSRALCCCPPEVHEIERPRPDRGKIVGAHAWLERELWEEIDRGRPFREDVDLDEDVDDLVRPPLEKAMDARMANVLSDLVARTAQRISTAIENPADQTGLDGQWMMSRLASYTLSRPSRARKLREPARQISALGRTDVGKLSKLMGKETGEVTRFDVVSMPAPALAQATQVSEEKIMRAQLEAFGVPTKAAPQSRSPRRSGDGTRSRRSSRRSS